MEVKMSRNEKWSIQDACSYLYQFESSIVKNNDKTMLPFCADIALKRLVLYDMCPSAFGGTLKREEIIHDIEEHIFKGRTTENTKRELKKVVGGFAKKYLDVNKD